MPPHIAGTWKVQGLNGAMVYSQERSLDFAMDCLEMPRAIQ